MNKKDLDEFTKQFEQERIDAGDWICLNCSNENWKVFIPKENEICPSCKKPKNECTK